MKVLCIIFTLVSLTACSGKRREEEWPIRTEYKTFEVIGVSRPKHFSIDLKDVETGEVFYKQFVSKHCNHWRNLAIGSKWVLRWNTYKEHSGYRMEIEGVRGEFCDRIPK